MTPSSRVLFLLADGARADVLEDLARSGSLPNIRRLFHLDEFPVRRAVTTMPSATGPAYLPFLTGRFAGALNIPGIRWFDRFAYGKRQRFAAKRSYVGLGNRYYDRDLDPSVKTIFQHEPDHVNVFNPVHRGVGKGRNKLNARRAWLSPMAKYFGRWRWLDASVRKATLGAVDSGTKLIFSTFMGIDENSHDHGVRSPQTLDAYKFLDESVGQAMQALHERQELKTTRIVLSSDHGLSDTHTHFPLAEHVQTMGYRALYYPKIWPRKPKAAVMVSGNALAHLYLQKKGSWAYRPRGAGLWAEHGDLMASLADHASVDLLAYRDEEANIVVQRGEDRVRFRRGDGRVKVETFGTDPLGLPAGMRVMEEEYCFQLSWDQEFPDAVLQLSQIFDSPRCGDVIVIAKPGHDLRRRFEVPGHAASHGGLHRDHMMVPLLVNDPALAIAPCRTVDVFAYLLQQLGRSVPPELDGRQLPLLPTPPITPPAPAPAPLPPAPTATPAPVPPGGPPA